jgi:hypothetical protein
MAQAIFPMKRVDSCERFKKPHVHIITDLGKETCDTPLFVLKREAALLSPGVSKKAPVTLMAKKSTKASSDHGTKKKQTPAKATKPRSAPAKPTPAPKAPKAPTFYPSEPNKEIRKKASELHGGEGQFRANSFLTWNHAVIFSARLRENLPFKYVGKNNRVSIQVDVFEDRIVLSRYVPPSAAQRFNTKNKDDAEALKLSGIASLTWNYAIIIPSHLTKSTGVKSYHLEGFEAFHYTSKTSKAHVQQEVIGDTVVLSVYTPPTESKARQK